MRNLGLREGLPRLAAFTSIREAAYPSRPSRSQSQHKAAEAAEARKRGELSARSAALPNAIASNRVKARPTAGAKAAEIRLRETYVGLRLVALALTQKCQ